LHSSFEFISHAKYQLAFFWGEKLWYFQCPCLNKQWQTATLVGKKERQGQKRASKNKQLY
jgi:hypothetical protein